MKHKFTKFLSAVSALAVTISAMPITGLYAIAEDETAETSIENIGGSSPEGIEETPIEDVDVSSSEESDGTPIEESKSDSHLVLSDFGEPMVMASQTGITKDEWIHDLVTVFDMSIEDDSTMEYYFTDIDNSDYTYEINLAANYGVFDIESNLFNPDDYVTREFAVHTANYCMNYLDDGTSVSFSDSSSIYYEYDAIVAVQRGWFKPSSGKFEPDKLMTQSEAKTILNDAKSSIVNVTVDANAKNTVNYESSVIQIDDIAASYFNGNVTLKGKDVTLKSGNVFCVSIDGVDRVYKASSVKKDSSGNTVVTVNDVAFEDAVSNINIQGYGDVNYADTVLYTTSSKKSAANLIYNKPNFNGVQKQLVKAVDISSDEISISEDIDLDGISLKLNGTISNITPEYKLDYDGINVNSFYLSVDADADLSCTMSGELKSTSSKEVNIAKIPVACAGIISANVVVSVSVSVTGEITMKYSWDINGGVSYTKDSGWRVTKNFKKKGFSISASGSEKIAVKAALNAEVLGFQIGELYAMGGEKGTFTHVPHNNGEVVCDNIRVYAFAEFGADLNILNIITFSKSYEFINYNNSPLRYNKHWENGVEVAECSFDESITSTSSSRNSSKAAYYSNYSSSGLEFDGSISEADEPRNQTWNEDMILESDITINGDLYLKSNVDLNGYTLTVNGNLIQTNGYMNVNNGVLNIAENYEISSDGYLDMYYGGDVNVGNDFIIGDTVDYNYNNYLNSGTISIGGNFYQYIADTTTSNFVQHYDHTVKFVGAGTHEIYFDSANSYLTNVVIDDGAKIKFTGVFTGFSLKQDIIIEGDTQLDLGTLALNGHKLTIEGDFTQNSSLDVYNGILDVQGNYIADGDANLYNNGEKNATITIGKQLSFKSGSFNLRNVTINIDSDLIQTNGYINVDGGVLTIGGNYEISDNGYLGMYNDSGNVNVGNDFIIGNTIDSYYNNCFCSGTISIGGNFYQYIADTTTSNFIQQYDHTVKFVGAGTHEIYFDSANSYLTNVVIDDGAKIKFTGVFTGFPLKQDVIIEGDTQLDSGTLALNGHKLTIEGDFTQNSSLDVYNGTLDVQGDYVVNNDANLYNNGEKNATITIEKQLSFKSGSFDLENVTINIDSDLIQTDGNISVNGGALTIGENYEISDNGYLDMYNGGDINVSNDFIIGNTIDSSYYDCFFNGTISIGGNFYQYIADTTTSNFIQYSDHTVKFVGAGSHTFYSESSDTTLTNLEIDEGATIVFDGSLNGMSMDKPTFLSSKTAALSVKNNSITGNSTGVSFLTMKNNGYEATVTVTVLENLELGDANGDGKLNVADVVLLQKWILAIPDTHLTAWRNVDVNYDNCIDVFDLVLLKKMLIKQS